MNSEFLLLPQESKLFLVLTGVPERKQKLYLGQPYWRFMFPVNEPVSGENKILSVGALAASEIMAVVQSPQFILGPESWRKLLLENDVPAESVSVGKAFAIIRRGMGKSTEFEVEEVK
jgi:hypothetical protein